MMIGIDDNQNLVYEGRTFFGHALLPAPFLSPAFIQPDTASNLVPSRFLNLHVLPLTLFREDAFDPVSRIRRGRFYKAGPSQPVSWRVYPHPAFPEQPDNAYEAGALGKTLFTFQSIFLASEFRELPTHQLLVSLGSEESYSVWTVLGIERIATGEELVTLKARQGIGALPRLRDAAIPELGRQKVIAVLEKLAEDFRRAGPESVVDCAREAATAALSVYMQDRKLVGPGLDLGDLLKELRSASDEHIRRIAISAGEIVQRFHSRRKNAEQEKRVLRPIREQDAELAVQCVGTILCELGWADWV